MAYYQSDNAEQYNRNASFVYSDDFTAAVLGLLDPQPGDKILDVGCGTGEVTEKIQAIVSGGPSPGYVIGVDVASDMISTARSRSKGQGARYEIVDAHDLSSWLLREKLEGSFDKVFSNAALHWMRRNPSQVVQGMRDSLRHGGLLAIEMGGHLNVAEVRSSIHSALREHSIDPLLVDPWYFPSAKAYSNVLVTQGFSQVAHAQLYPRITPLSKTAGLFGFLVTFAGPFLNALASDDAKIDVVRRVEDQLREVSYDKDEDQWAIMNCRLRVQAIK